MNILQITILFAVVAVGLLLAFCLDVRLERRRRMEKRRYDRLRWAYIDLLNKQKQDYKESLNTVMRGYEKMVREANACRNGETR